MSALNEMVQELAHGLRDVIAETPDGAFETSPEHVYVDLACRLVIRLSDKISILPRAEVFTSERVKSEEAEAACRILSIFTDWLRKNPTSTLSTGFAGHPRGDFEVLVDDHLVFRGESLQDAYGQAATTIELGRS